MVVIEHQHSYLLVLTLWEVTSCPSLFCHCSISGMTKARQILCFCNGQGEQCRTAAAVRECTEIKLQLHKGLFFVFAGERCVLSVLGSTRCALGRDPLLPLLSDYVILKLQFCHLTLRSASVSILCPYGKQVGKLLMFTSCCNSLWHG